MTQFPRPTRVLFASMACALIIASCGREKSSDPKDEDPSLESSGGDGGDPATGGNAGARNEAHTGGRNDPELGGGAPSDGDDPETPWREGSAIEDLLDEVYTGPQRVDCEVESECVIGSCEGDTHPCSGDFVIELASDLQELEGCTSVSGDLVVRASDLTDLAALRSLVSVGGSLTIENTSLQTVAGLDHLVAIGGDFNVGTMNPAEMNTALVSLHGLEALRFVGGQFNIWNNPALLSLDGLRLKALQGELALARNPLLGGVEALSTVTCLGGFQLIASPLVPSLEGLEGLEQLGLLVLDSDDALADISALKDLRWIPGRLWLSGMKALSDLSGLRGLIGVGEIDFFDTERLISLSGLENLKVVRGNFRAAVADYTGLSGLRVVGGSLRGAQESVRGMESLEGVTQLIIEGEVDLAGLPSDLIVGTLFLRYHNQLEDLTALSEVWITDGLDISATMKLRSLDGLQHPDHWAGSILLKSNDSLQSLAALEGLKSIDGRVAMDFNPALDTYDGLDDLQWVGQDVWISRNGPSRSEGFVGLQNLREIQGSLVVQYDYDPALVSAVEKVGTLELLSTSFTDLTPFAHILVKSGLRVIGGENLVSLTGLRHDGDLDGDLQLGNLPALVDIQGLRGVHTVGGRLDVSSTALTSLSGLDDLESVGGGLGIVGNDELLSVDGLDRLTTVAAWFEIRGNVLLQSLEGLDNLAPLPPFSEWNGARGTIVDNPQLSQCVVEALLERVLDEAEATSSGNDESVACN